MTLATVVTNIVDNKNGPGLLRSPKAAENPVFAFIGNGLGFGGSLFPNGGLVENRSGFEWEMGCISWQQETDSSKKENVGGINVGGLNVGGSQQFVPKAIKFRCNPSDVSWSMPQRSVEQKTKAGTVLHTWNDTERNSYFDEPTLTFTLQSGNILPTRSIVDPRGTIPTGLNNFYEFMSLVDEVKVLDDGRANLCYINYNSLIFPKITLWGFWQPNGISFVDAAASHAQVNNWKASFTVYKSFPELGRTVATDNATTVVDGSLAGESLRTTFNSRSGFTFSNKRSETFGLAQDAAISAQAIVTGQIPPRDIGAAAAATINAASQRTVQRLSTGLAGAVALGVAGVTKAPIF